MPNAQRHCGRERKKREKEPKPNLAQSLQYMSHSLHSQTCWELQPSGWRSKRRMRGSKTQKDSQVTLISNHVLFYFEVNPADEFMSPTQWGAPVKHLHHNNPRAPRPVHVWTTSIGLYNKPEERLSAGVWQLHWESFQKSPAVEVRAENLEWKEDHGGGGGLWVERQRGEAGFLWC